MGRPREFDEADVVSRARNAFWENGIASTSISDLTEATGLSAGSIYKAFDCKSQLTHRALDAYLEEGLASTAATLDGADTSLGGIEAWLDDAASRAGEGSPNPGCFATVCAIELAGTDPVARDRLRAHDRRLRAVVSGAIRNAVADGELDCDPQDGARMLCTAVNGVAVEARKGITSSDARSTLRLALRALG